MFLKDVATEKALVSNKISFGEKSSKYFIGYLYNGNKVKPLHKTSAYVKSVMDKLNGCIIWLKMMTY